MRLPYNATANAAFVAHAVSIMPDVELPAVRVSEPRDGFFVLEFSRIMAGIAICPNGPQTIRVDYAETLKTSRGGGGGRVNNTQPYAH
jgi:hypothetical protein